MIRKALPIAFLIVFNGSVLAQPAKPAQSPTPQTRPTTSFDLSEYGVKVQPDARLIIVMAALEAEVSIRPLRVERCRRSDASWKRIKRTSTPIYARASELFISATS